MNAPTENPLVQFKHLLVVDLEATCWAEGRGPRQDMETIELGAVLVRLQDMEPIDERSWFIKPRLHPVLSDFCTQLTSITQSQVDGGGISFRQMSDELVSWLAPHGERLAWGSWGNYDLNQLELDARRIGIVSPLIPHVNLKAQFSILHCGKERAPGMRRALSMCGLEIRGTHHRGIDDARNIARLLPWLLDRKLIRSRKASSDRREHGS